MMEIRFERLEGALAFIEAIMLNCGCFRGSLGWSERDQYEMPGDPEPYKLDIVEPRDEITELIKQGYSGTRLWEILGIAKEG